MPKALVEDYLEQEPGTRAFLDELQKLAAEGRHDEVRDRLRDFADHSQGAFFTVALSLGGTAQFFADVEAQMDPATGEKLRDLEESYGNLAEEFSIVRSEQTQNRLNPITSLSASTTYESEEEVPLVEYTPLSGDRELFDSRESPEEVLQAAHFLVQATTDALEQATEHDQKVNTEELSALIDRREELEMELSRLRDQIDELRRTPVDE
jgi:archaellum component FlaC